MNTAEQEDPVPAASLADLDTTILAQLLRMLKHPVINENRSLIDKMLNLLGLYFYHFLRFQKAGTINIKKNYQNII